MPGEDQSTWSIALGIHLGLEPSISQTSAHCVHKSDEVWTWSRPDSVGAICLEFQASIEAGGERLFMAGTVSSQARQEADVRSLGLAGQWQLSAKPGNSHCRPSADVGRQCASTRLRLGADVRAGHVSDSSQRKQSSLRPAAKQTTTRCAGSSSTDVTLRAGRVDGASLPDPSSER